ncbi:MAG: TerY-C metal binding domain-containing protein [Lachnospiraceae bacterium]|nr:TerY-C metal binding domain-containing protein [Lachnospiraceae bacterium]
MSELNNDAFAIMAMCEETKEHFGITVNPVGGNHFVFTWAFRIKKDQAKREGYDQKQVKGSVSYDANFNGCPYCNANAFYICSRCKKVVCYHGQESVTCPNCGSTSTVKQAESVDLSGGGF